MKGGGAGVEGSVPGRAYIQDERYAAGAGMRRSGRAHPCGARYSSVHGGIHSESWRKVPHGLCYPDEAIEHMNKTSLGIGRKNGLERSGIYVPKGLMACAEESLF